MKTLVRMASLLGALVLTTATGCLTVSTAQFQGVTSGQIGCPASEILINNPVQGAITSWEAECRGRKYYCSAAGKTLSCKEALPASDAAPRQP